MTDLYASRPLSYRHQLLPRPSHAWRLAAFPEARESSYAVREVHIYHRPSGNGFQP